MVRAVSSLPMMNSRQAQTAWTPVGIDRSGGTGVSAAVGGCGGDCVGVGINVGVRCVGRGTRVEAWVLLGAAVTMGVAATCGVQAAQARINESSQLSRA
jgi:hypothetical protein